MIGGRGHQHNQEEEGISLLTSSKKAHGWLQVRHPEESLAPQLGASGQGKKFFADQGMREGQKARLLKQMPRMARGKNGEKESKSQ